MHTLFHRASAPHRALIALCLIAITAPVPGPDARAQESSSTTVGGFADLYYAYSMLAPANRTRSYTTQPLRHNEFALNLGMVDVRHTGGSVRGRFAFQTGTYVESNLAAEPQLLKYVLEASAGTRLGDDVWIDVGIFPSHIGFEGILSRDNWNYSRSMVAEFSPYYEAGVSVTAALSGRVTLRGLVLNGWQNIAETNDDKAVGAQLQITPAEDVLLNWSSFLGNEQPDTAASRPRFFNDLYGVWTISPVWSLALIVDVGMQKRIDASAYDLWHGGALLARCAFADRWTAAARAEYFADPKGIVVATGTPGNFETAGGSVNLDYAASSAFLWRLEARVLHASEAVYPSDDGMEPTEVFLVLSTAVSL